MDEYTQEEFDARLEKAIKARDKVIEEAVALFVAAAVGVIRVDPYQEGRVPDDYSPEFPCQTVRAELHEIYNHVTEEVYQKALDAPWFRT